MALGPDNFMARKKFAVFALVLQGIFILLFGLFAEYKESQARPGNDSIPNNVDALYPMFMDVHSMMFIGFGFLMAFLARHGYSSVGINFLLGAVVIQWATLVLGLFHQYPGFNHQIGLELENLLTADFAAAAVMITFGALLGKVSALQLLVIALFEIIFFAVNEMIGVKIFFAVDIGGSMFVHTFGAYFGLAVSRVLAPQTRLARKTGSSKEVALYHSDIFAMLGTIVLWLYWPSFNGSPTSGVERHRVVINTYYSLASCVVVTFALSQLFSKEDKLDMVHVQNATLAGGVAVGATADFLIDPWGAMLIGAVGALVSVFGYAYIQPFLQTNLKLHDTCGVHNLHGMPGVLAGLASVVATATISLSRYGNTQQLGRVYEEISLGNRTQNEQAGYQLAALVVTLAISLIGGAVTGLLVRLAGGALDPLADNEEEMFDDHVMWHVNSETHKPATELVRACSIDEPNIAQYGRHDTMVSLDNMRSRPAKITEGKADDSRESAI